MTQYCFAKYQMRQALKQLYENSLSKTFQENSSIITLKMVIAKTLKVYSCQL